MADGSRPGPAPVGYRVLRYGPRPSAITIPVLAPGGGPAEAAPVTVLGRGRHGCERR
jgi:hypothetical protein